MFGFFKKVIGKNNQKLLGGNSQFDPLLAEIIEEAKKSNDYIYANSQLKFKDGEAYQRLKAFDPKHKKDFVLYLQQQVIAADQLAHPNKQAGQYAKSEYERYAICQNLFALLMRSKLKFNEDEFLSVVNTYLSVEKDVSTRLSFVDWPIGFTANQLVKFMKENEPSTDFIKSMETLLRSKPFQTARLYSGMDVGKSREKMLDAISSRSGKKSVLPYEVDQSEDFGVFLNQLLNQLAPEQQENWYGLLHHCANSSGAKPKKNWLAKSNQLIDEMSVKSFKPVMQSMLEVAASLSLKEREDWYYDLFLADKNKELLKGLVWMASRFHDAKSLQLVAKLAEKSYQKIPGIGPGAISLGNACFYTLAQSKGLEGISHLSRLKLRIRQNSAQKIINTYIELQGEKHGLAPSQIEELAVSDFGLNLGERKIDFEDFQLRLSITGVGKAQLEWIKPDGKIQKTVPSFVKNNAKLTEKLKKVRNDVKQIKQNTTAQRDRIDRLYTEKRIWEKENFEKFYINHGLVSSIARKLIWSFKQAGEDKPTPVYLQGEHWQDITGHKITLDDQTQIRLWHPIDSSTKEVLAWRDKLDEWQIQQPMKQAYREVYLLTDAEINTRVYSNRMASHFLKQHQFNALAALRGWKYSLLGAYDDGRDGEKAIKILPAYGLSAEFWIYELQDTEAWNDAGIWDYVATDQLRFVQEDGEPLNLIDVDKLLLSEIMRDADLFVGVASVGNDPQWQDKGGLAQFHDYWQGYSFGDLSELAKTRKQVLERLVPRLKIRDVASIDGKFLMVKGTKHTYKIHIGSTNILIAPSDKYLCIVPSAGKDKNVQNLFLPFEGDRGLSIILSKAFMLAEDDKITDKTILSQI